MSKKTVTTPAKPAKQVHTEKRNPNNPFPFADDKARRMALGVLRLHAITKVEVSFDGSGDDGQVQDVSYYIGDDLSTQDVGGIMVPYKQSGGSSMVNGKWVQNVSNKDMTLTEMLTEVCYDAAGQTDVDWVNNEGGYGKLVIDLTVNPAKVTLNISARVITTEDHHYEY